MTEVAEVQTGGVSYPLSLRDSSYKAWKAVVGIILLVFGFVAAQIGLVVLGAVVALLERGDFTHNFEQLFKDNPLTPASFLILNIGIAGLIPISMFLVWLIHGRKVSTLMSVRPGVRWKFFLACLGLAVISFVLNAVLALFLPEHSTGSPGPAHHFGWQTTLAFLAVIVFTTPLQSMAEEYGFRGYAMQLIGALTKSPWVAILATALLFAAAHGPQNVPLAIDRFVFGLIAGYLVYRTGGLESGIAFHISNNLIVFFTALAFSDISKIFAVNSTSWWDLAATVIQSGVYVAMVLAVAKRMNLRTTTAGAA